MTILAGWGRFPRLDCPLVAMRDADEARRAVAANNSLIARGNGRSYGDAALNGKCTLSTLRSDRIRAFDGTTGLITCEAGLLLADLIRFSLRHGFFPMAVPGTKFVTVGGMIAADIHGKNHHHAGTFCRNVVSLDLLIADDSIVTCSRTQNAELFFATCGGMGLTGVVLEATIRLMPVETGYIRQETVLAGDLETAFEIARSSAGWTYSVAWIDCLARGRHLGRSILYRGEHLRLDEAAGMPPDIAQRRVLRVPMDPPAFTLNRWSLRLFNELYYRHAKPGETVIDYDRYFFPLDALLEWNRIYGGTGFVQYQCVIPTEAAAAALRLILERISRAGGGSFLAVLKLLGAEGDGLLSFPMEGCTLALDFPANAANFGLLITLDAIVADHGGRLYLAKDARMGTALLRRGYPRLQRFQTVRQAVDPNGRFSSLLSQRLGL